MGYRTPFTLMPDEECIDYESDVTAGELSVNDAYDLYLIAKGKEPKNYTLVCFMNLQFFFQDTGKLVWTDQEKKDYISKWEKSIRVVWAYKILKSLKDGRKIVLDFKFKTKTEGVWLSDHWELSVRKTSEDWAQSYVSTHMGNSQLDDKDLNFAEKPSGEKQRGSVHEFGHMLGLDDEYLKGSVWINDKKSVMNNGEIVMGRHLTFFAAWLNKKLTKHKIQ
jgi:hypothetical protein